jgi:hypothetical protein
MLDVQPQHALPASLYTFRMMEEVGYKVRYLVVKCAINIWYKDTLRKFLTTRTFSTIE